jgi:hypothetical protein
MRRRLPISSLIFLVFLPAAASALEITAVSPVVASPGAVVTILGGPFSAEAKVILGDRPIEPTAAAQRQLIFTVPPLAEGEYTLSVQDGQEISPPAFTLAITAPEPFIGSLGPSNIDTCAPDNERRVIVTGRDFAPGASLLLDGKIVAHTALGPESLSFVPPALPSGAYGVQVINPDGKKSLPHSLYINDIPEILNVYQGEEFVNYYQVVIEGKNFTFDSNLVINEYPVGFYDLPPQQRVISPQSDVGSPGKLPRPSQSDNLRYIDCGTLIYNRYPYSNQPKRVSVKVVNPDGKETSTYELAIP